MKFESFLAEDARGKIHKLPQQHFQVVTLGFLSKTLPSALIATQFAKHLSTETRASVVVVKLQCGGDYPLWQAGFDTYATVVDWAPSESVLQGQFQSCSLIRTESGFHLLTLDLKAPASIAERLPSLLTQLRRHFRFILIEAPLDGPLGESLLACQLPVDLSYLFLQPKVEEVLQLEPMVKKLRGERLVDSSRFKPVLVLEEKASGEVTDSLAQRATVPIERFVHGCPIEWNANSPTPVSNTGSFAKDIRRLARELGGRMVGLALSSGAAKGFAHIGCIQVLEENGIEVDIVAGASIGAYIGAVWTYGYNGQELEKLAREMESRWGLWSLMDPAFPPRQGFLRGHALKRRLMRSIGSVRFCELPRPMRIVAGNLGSLDRTILMTGEVAAAAHASMAVPGICVPVTLGQESYIDGGIVDPVPVDILRDAGAAKVIAVNVIPTPERMRLGFQVERELAAQNQKPLRKLFRKVLPLDKQLNYFAQGNLFEILARSIHGAQVRLAEASCRLADVVLRPDILDDRWLDCRNPGRFIALGREAAEQNIESIKALVAKNQFSDDQEIPSGTVAAVA